MKSQVAMILDIFSGRKDKRDKQDKNLQNI